jgi:4-diphosphocytidyl-2-C-methyl-D-erythritol kinase
MSEALARAKLNLALVVGPIRSDGKHEVATVLQALDLADRITLESAPVFAVRGFADDTLVRTALERLAAAAGVEPRWSAAIDKQIPVSAGLGGGSSDAAAALRLANMTLREPLAPERLLELAAGIGADVPFFLGPSCALGTGDGSTLAPLDLPCDYWVLLVLPDGAAKVSTAAIYAAFDAQRGEEGFEERRSALEAGLARVRGARDLATLPPNDLARSHLAEELLELGALRADVTGAGPTVYGLFAERADAERALEKLSEVGHTWLTAPAWYV